MWFTLTFILVFPLLTMIYQNIDIKIFNFRILFLMELHKFNENEIPQSDQSI